MSSSTNQPEAKMPPSLNEPETDWEVTSDGLYIATRHFLVRRGYCCANRCRNCPYINWRSNPAWQHASATAIRYTRVSPKALAGARTALAFHEQALNETLEASEQTYHQELCTHYRLLLECWR